MEFLPEFIIPQPDQYCVSCKRNSLNAPECHFFRFPKDPYRCAIWKRIVNLKKVENSTSVQCYKRYRLCSKHFASTMFANEKRNRLKKSAIPTMSLENSISHSGKGHVDTAPTSRAISSSEGKKDDKEHCNSLGLAKSSASKEEVPKKCSPPEVPVPPEVPIPEDPKPVFLTEPKVPDSPKPINFQDAFKNQLKRQRIISERFIENSERANRYSKRESTQKISETSEQVDISKSPAKPSQQNLQISKPVKNISQTSTPRPSRPGVILLTPVQTPLKNSPQTLIPSQQTTSVAPNKKKLAAPPQSIIIIPPTPGGPQKGIYLLPQNLAEQQLILPMVPSKSMTVGQNTISTRQRKGCIAEIRNEGLQNGLEVDKLKCRTCLDLVPNLEQAPVTMICFEEKTVRQGLIQLMPDMESILTNDQFICMKCFLILRNTLKFMKNCLETQNIIASELKNSNTDVHNGETNVNIEVSAPEVSENVKFDTENEGSYESELEYDPNIEEEDYVLSNITHLIKKDNKIIDSKTNEKESDLDDCVLNHLNFLPFEYARIREHDNVISVNNLNPNFLLSLQESHIPLLSNCKKFDENIFENKRVLLLGNHTEIKCILCDQQFPTEAKMHQHVSDVHNLPASYLMETCYYQYRPGLSTKCRACGKDCVTQEGLWGHMKSCYVFPCPYCSELFNWNKLPEHTMNEHGDPKPFKCFRCKQENADYLKFKGHLCEASICELCGKHFTDKRSFLVHNGLCRNDGGLRKCYECNERFALNSYAAHVKTHKFPCSVCGKIFHQSSQLTKHECTHKSKKSSLCPLCGKIYHSLKRHMEVHENNRQRTVKCIFCPKSFFTKGHYQSHLQACHETKIVCGICRVRCNARTLENHFKLVHSKETDFQCAHCDATFSQIALLKQHNNSHVEEEEEEEGEEEETTDVNRKRKRISNSRGYLKKYKFRIKMPSEPVTCKYCLKKFKTIHLYKKHLETHLQLYRYQCRYCDLTYSSQSCRMKHEKMHKDPNYKFRCNECWKTTKSEEELQAHMLTHARPKKYQCGECSEFFAREYQLHSHLVTKHAENEDMEEARDDLIRDALMDFAV